MNVYENLPVLEGENFVLRGVAESDTEDLLKVYSDKAAVPFFNGDNCHGDDFYYATIDRMREAVAFWLFSYAHGYFVRWAVVEKLSGSAIGTIELFHRDSDKDYFDNCGLLRLDLRSDCECADIIEEVISLIKNPAFDWFYCDKIATKIKPFAFERIKAMVKLGFLPSNQQLVGNDGVRYSDYYVLTK